MVFCPSCGTKNEEGTKFCKECGRSLADVNKAREAMNPPTGEAMTDEHGQMLGDDGLPVGQDLDGVPEADALGLHHPVDRRAARLALAEAVPEVLRRSHDEGRLAVVVEGTAADQVRTVPLQLDAPGFRETLERDLFTDSPEQLVGDSCHRSPPSGRNAVSARGCQGEKEGSRVTLYAYTHGKCIVCLCQWTSTGSSETRP